MGLVIGTILSFMYLDPPWRYLVIVPLAAWEIFEIWLYFYLRGKKPVTGAEALVGAIGRTQEPLNPSGQVMVKGQLWGARARHPLEAGEPVVVTDVEGMRLVVRPRDRD
ncbi:MAG TPA: NfeD family protein [Actinomycetota bacterium]|jgi:membrane-bound ClpP family serine protease|nr:NfeD family protein [Actinomycetota bacterium]